MIPERLNCFIRLAGWFSPEDLEEFSASARGAGLLAISEDLVTDSGTLQTSPVAMAMLDRARRVVLPLGLLDNRGRLFLATQNTEPTLLHATAVSIAAIRDCLSQSRCQRFVLVLDCCYSGAATAAFRQAGGVISSDFNHGDPVEGVGEFVMAASTAIQRAVETQDDTLCQFTRHLLADLREFRADTDGDGVIRLDELFEYVRKAMSAEQQQEPLHWVSGSAASFIIGRTPKSRENQLQRFVRDHLRNGGRRKDLPASILTALEEMVQMDISEFRTRYNATGWLACGWAHGEIATDDFIDQWYRLRSNLSGVDQPADVPVEKRWRVVHAARKSVLDWWARPTYSTPAFTFWTGMRPLTKWSRNLSASCGEPTRRTLSSRSRTHARSSHALSSSSRRTPLNGWRSTRGTSPSACGSFPRIRSTGRSW
jgi:hypothetical protein